MTLDEDRGVIVLPCRVNHKVTRMLLGFPDPIKGYPSCEIDSVGFVDRAGKTWWAESAQPGVLMPGQRPAE